MENGRPHIELADARLSGAGVYLTRFLAPFLPFLRDENVTDIIVNKAGEIWVETHQGFSAHQVASIDWPLLTRLASQIARITHQSVSGASPLLSAALPSGERVQMILPPATRDFPALALRKHGNAELPLSAFTVDGPSKSSKKGKSANTKIGDKRINWHKLAKKADSPAARAEFLSQLIKERANIVVSGGTGSGKTTLLNALLAHVDDKERLILIEDAPEIQLRQPNHIGLIAVKNGQGKAQINVDDLLAASLRMRPDRLIVGELRGAEAYTFLRAINTGHPGSCTTIHANSCARAIEQLGLMTLAAQPNLPFDGLMAYVRSVVDVVVQVERIGQERLITEIMVLDA